ncbi:hypothetical protein C8R43DRAFT_1113255 [Mycena crocata]|nr:hypothetical protein C8R43DRAFT_1113255 [Mycena crocata]
MARLEMPSTALNIGIHPINDPPADVGAHRGQGSRIDVFAVMRPATFVTKHDEGDLGEQEGAKPSIQASQTLMGTVKPANVFVDIRSAPGTDGRTSAGRLKALTRKLRLPNGFFSAHPRLVLAGENVTRTSRRQWSEISDKLSCAVLYEFQVTRGGRKFSGLMDGPGVRGYRTYSNLSRRNCPAFRDEGNPALFCISDPHAVPGGEMFERDLGIPKAKRELPISMANG